jgi:hypothetical protein
MANTKDRATLCIHKDAAEELSELERLLLTPAAQRILNGGDLSILHGDTGEGPQGIGRRYAYTRGSAVRVAIRYLARIIAAEAREGKP